MSEPHSIHPNLLGEVGGFILGILTITIPLLILL
jgi:hypothetical protein